MTEVNVKVAVRLRPFNEREKSANSTSVIDILRGQETIIKKPDAKDAKDAKENEKRFTFDHAYDDSVPNETVYKDLGVPILQKALEGYNATVFAYGQTGSGKTFCMMGEETPGIIPSINMDIFAAIEAAPDNKQFLVTVSYLEIYMEVVKDLLNPTDKGLRVREHPQLGIYVEDLAELVVKNEAEVMALMNQGNRMRQVGSTNMNVRSSRSHSIFTLRIEQKEDIEDENIVRTYRSKINLVDLAGSERAASTGASGKRLKEGASINKSLATLGNVINALADPKKRGGHIPYRDSHLTRILQESLGGNTLTVMIATLSPASINYDETLSTLNYANRAKNIKNVSKRNENESQKIIRELRDEIEELRTQLQAASEGKGINTDQVAEMERKIADLEMAKKQTWEEKEKLSNLYEQERQRHLSEKGLLELVMETLRSGSEELSTKLADLQKEKERLLQEFTTLKPKNDALKNELQGEVQRYSEDIASGKMGSDGKKRLEKINALKSEMRSTNDRLKKLKKEIMEVSQKQHSVKHDLRLQTAFLEEDTQMREQIKQEEQKKAAELHQKMLEEEKEKMRREVEEAKKRIVSEQGAIREGGGGAWEEELTRLKMELSEAKAGQTLLKRHLETKEKEIAELEIDSEAQQTQFKDTLEHQQLQYFQVFRAYREHFENERRHLEERYGRVIEQCVADCVSLSTRNRELEDQLLGLREQVDTLSFTRHLQQQGEDAAGRSTPSSPSGYGEEFLPYQPYRVWE